MTYDFYPFNSRYVVWKEGNKALLIESEVVGIDELAYSDSIHFGYVCIEKNMIEKEMCSLTEVSKIVMDGHLCKVETIKPLLEDRSLWPVIRDSKNKRLDNARELSKGDPNTWLISVAEIEEQYQKDLNDAGYTHLTYGFCYPGTPSQGSVIDALQNLEKQILEF